MKGEKETKQDRKRVDKTWKKEKRRKRERDEAV